MAATPFDSCVGARMLTQSVHAIYAALPNNGCWAAKWGSLLELGLRFLVELPAC